jgi:N4-gp56 family major capsid protein
MNWTVPAEGGYLYADELSEVLRSQVQPLTKFRQLADAEDGTQKGLNRGELFTWDVYSNVGTQGRALDETTPMPETGFTIIQHSLTVTEAGNAVPFTQKLEFLSFHSVSRIIDKALKDDARKFFDIACWEQFNRTQLHVVPASGTSTTAITLSTTGLTGLTDTNNIEYSDSHAKLIADMMKERNIPPFIQDDYVAISHPSTYRTLKNSMETKYSNTETGLAYIFSGEIGRYEGVRYIEQNFIPKGGAKDTLTTGVPPFDAYAGQADPWNNGKSSWIFFCGGDTVTEAIVIPEEIRAKLPGDFGRSKAIAWYYLGGFGLVHDDALNGRVVKWNSAA